MGDVESRVRTRLRRVLDPCSCATDDPINIVDMGIVDAVAVEGSTARVTLITEPLCLYTMQMSDEIRRRVGALDGVDEVVVDRRTDDFWTPDMMDEDLKAERREQFLMEIARNGGTPGDA